MLVVTTEYSEAYLELNKLPTSRIIRQVMSSTSKLVNKPSLFGKSINVLFVYGNFSSIFRTGINSWEGHVFCVCQPRYLYAFSFFLQDAGIEFRFVPPTKEENIRYLMGKYFIDIQKAEFLLKFFEGRMVDLERNEDSIPEILAGKIKVENFLDISRLNYNTVLLYLCGDPSVSKDNYILTVTKYRYSGKHIIDYLCDQLENFIFILMGESSSKKIDIKLMQKMAETLTLEVALLLQSKLKPLSCVDLLKGDFYDTCVFQFCTAEHSK